MNLKVNAVRALTALFNIGLFCLVSLFSNVQTATAVAFIALFIGAMLQMVLSKRQVKPGIDLFR